jgi:hypothetical protein
MPTTLVVRAVVGLQTVRRSRIRAAVSRCPSEGCARHGARRDTQRRALRIASELDVSTGAAPTGAPRYRASVVANASW